MANVLSSALVGRSKTSIMRKCNLSYRQLQTYLSLLVDLGLIRVDLHEGKSNPAVVFITTGKGRAFLRSYEGLKRILSKEDSSFQLAYAKG